MKKFLGYLILFLIFLAFFALMVAQAGWKVALGGVAVALILSIALYWSIILIEDL